MDHTRQNERGMALILALIALLIVTSIGLSMMFMADTETSINSNFRDEQTAYYAARSGLEEARDRMRSAATDTLSGSLPTGLPGAANGVVYIINPAAGETVAPWLAANKYYDDEICKEVNCGGAAVPTTSGWYVNPALAASTVYTANPVMPYKWMRITMKTNASASGWSGGAHNYMYVDGNAANANYYVCWNGSNEIAQAAACASPKNPVYLLTALALTPSGTRRMLQYELTQDSLNLAFPSALTLNGTANVMSGPNSNPYNVSGADHPGCGGSASATALPAVGINDTSTANKNAVIAGIPSNRQSHYTGSSAAPDVEDISLKLKSNMQSVSSLQALLTTIRNNVTQPVLTGNQSGLSNAGTAASPQIIYVNGDLSLNGNVTGYGILVVTGNFSPGGNVGWNGIVLVVGSGVITGNGGGNASYNGAIMVAKTVDLSGNPLATLGASTFAFSGGGGNGVYYSSGCIAQASTLSNYRTIAARELMY